MKGWRMKVISYFLLFILRQLAFQHGKRWLGWLLQLREHPLPHPTDFVWHPTSLADLLHLSILVLGWSCSLHCIRSYFSFTYRCKGIASLGFTGWSITSNGLSISRFGILLILQIYDQVTGKFRGGHNPFTEGCARNCLSALCSPHHPK